MVAHVQFVTVLILAVRCQHVHWLHCYTMCDLENPMWVRQCAGQCAKRHPKNPNVG